MRRNSGELTLTLLKGMRHSRLVRTTAARFALPWEGRAVFALQYLRHRSGHGRPR